MKHGVVYFRSYFHAYIYIITYKTCKDRNKRSTSNLTLNVT